MAKTQRVQVPIMLKNVRISFPTLFEPDVVNQGDRPAFSAKFLIDKEDEENKKIINQAIMKVCKGKWKDKWKRVFKKLKAADKMCVIDGDEKTDDNGNTLEGYEGHLVVSARSYVRPTIINRARKPISEKDGVIYSGCYVNAALAIWAQSGKWGLRVNAQLQGVQYVKDGEAFGGGKAASPDVFDNLADEFDDDIEDIDADDIELDDDDLDDDDLI